MYIRSCLLVAVGLAAGITSASVSPRPAVPPPPPQVEARTGLVEADSSVRALTPLSIRVGDDITQLSPPDPGLTDRALVYLDVNGERVILALAVEPAPAGTPPASGPLAPPVRPTGAAPEVAPRLDS